LSVLSKPTNGGVDYPTRIGALFDAYDPLPRNYLANGKMEISQRYGLANGFAIPSGPAYNLDRWLVAQSGGVAALSFQQTLTGWGPLRRCMITQRNSGTTTTGGIAMLQVLETSESIELAGKTVTFSVTSSCGVDYSGGGHYAVQIYGGTGTDQSASAFYNGTWTGQTILLNTIFNTNSLGPTQQQATFTVPTNITQIGVMFIWNPTGTAGANDYLAISGTKLEIGSVASAWSFVPYADELLRCQRYYEKSYNDSASVPTSGSNSGYVMTPAGSAALANAAVIGSVRFKVTKRVVPTVTVYSFTASVASKVSDGNGADLAANSGTPISVGTGGFQVQNASGGTITPALNALIWHFAADAEL
jgi:hypothetical protein